eukprot:scaffold125009_cov57-Phaeocystis_antarctica.AAC.1
MGGVFTSLTTRAAACLRYRRAAATLESAAGRAVDRGAPVTSRDSGQFGPRPRPRPRPPHHPSVARRSAGRPAGRATRGSRRHRRPRRTAAPRCREIAR